MEGCYWICTSKDLARRDCDKAIFYLDINKTRDLPANQVLNPYVGTRCPCCGKPVMIDEHSYELIDS